VRLLLEKLKSTTMKTKSLLILLFFAISISFVNAQEYILPEDIDYKKHFFFGKAGWLRKTDKTAVQCKTALHFKLVSKATAMAGKGMDSRAFATSYAILQGVSEETMQQITDEYYMILQRKLQEAGFKMVPFEKVKQSSVYDKMVEKEKDRTYSNKSRGAALTFTAYNGPNGKYQDGNIGYWGLYKKLSKETKAVVINAEVIIEFANFDINLKKSRGFRYESASAKASVVPDVIITPFTSVDAYGTTTGDQTQSHLTFLDSKGMSFSIAPNKSISFGGDFATKVDSYSGEVPKVMKKHLSLTSDLSLTTGTFEIIADEEQFKKDVLEALEKYADILVAKLKMTLEK
jgi:hypothetical protein